MQQPPIHSSRAGRKGFTALEIVIAVGITGTIVAAIFGLAARDTQMAGSTMGIALSEMKAQQMLRRLESELANARGEAPIAFLTEDLGAGETDIVEVDSTLGFPPGGTLLLSRGTNNVERIDYAGLTVAQDQFTELGRGAQCTEAFTHASGSGDAILWSGLAETIELQTNPPANTWDGQSIVAGGSLFYRGDGSGFSYRVPIDPTGAIPPNYLAGDGLTWGQSIGGTPSANNWSCLYFSPSFTITEAGLQRDLNNDGDQQDIFDVGQIRRRIWNTADPAVAPADLGLGSTNILQEQCNWGGDLDADGFQDPLFLWDTATHQLHIQLLVLGYTGAEMPITRRVNTIVYMRNQLAN